MIFSGVITCAGLSSRMGAFKPLLPFQGSTFVERCVDTMLAAGVTRVTLVLGHRGREIETALAGRGYEGVSTVYNSDYANSDMFASARIGLRAALAAPPPSPPGAVFVLPVDAPAVRAATLRAMMEAMTGEPGGVIVPVCNGRRGHPPLIHASCISFIVNDFSGEGGLKGAFPHCGLRCIAVDDPGAALDADTQEDYQVLKSL